MNQNQTDPRVVGGHYLCGDCRQEYTVLAIGRYVNGRWQQQQVHDDLHDLCWTVKWADGRITEHSTAWDTRRDKVLA